MYTRIEIETKIDDLRKVSPSDSNELFAAFDEALSNYFERDDEFTRQVKYTIHHIVNEVETRAYSFVNSGNMPTMSTAYPKGYDDVTTLFDTDGAFEEIMTIESDVFIAAFALEPIESDDDSQPAETEMVNPILESWTTRITEAVDKEYAGLKHISTFCEDCVYDVGLAMYFEDYYEANNPYKEMDYSRNQPKLEPLDKVGIARKIFVDGGYLWLRDTFKLKMYVPRIES